MLRALAIGLTAVTLSGCVTDGIVQDTSREAAKRVVTPIVVDKFPGRNTEAYSNCIIDNATTDEIFSLAKAAVTGVDQDTVNTVYKIGTRPETLKCVLKVELGSAI
ncbi:succinate dehydrogenase [Profundibacter sp.]